MTKTTTPNASSPLATEMREKINTQPECQLLWAILEEAIETYMKYAPATQRRGQRLFHEAEEWIFRDDDTWVCSFTNICHVLEIDSNYIRTGLIRWRDTQRTSAKHKAA